MSSPERPAFGQSPVFRRTLELNLASRNKSASFKWSLVNGVMFAIFAYDLSCKCPNYTTYFHLMEYGLATVLGLNALYHAVRYVYLAFNMSPVPVTPAQKKLLGFTDLGLSPEIMEEFHHFWREDFEVVHRELGCAIICMSNKFSLLTEDTRLHHNNMDEFIRSFPQDTSYRLKSPERPAATPGGDRSEPFDVSARSWRTGSSPDTSPRPAAWRATPPSPRDASAALDFSTAEDFISDRRSLDDYLRLFEQKEAMSLLNGSADELDAGGAWGPPPDLAVRLRPQYQLAPLNAATSAAEEGGAGGGGAGSPHVWWRLHLDPQHLTQWNLNLRLWISATVLERLVKEIASIDETLHKHGLSDVKVGMVGLERLRKTASGASTARYAPTLPALVPFLELDNNQEYLVQRIRELASGGCMSAYKWNGGGTFKDKSWDEGLPTDSELVMHMLATYLDTQLLPVTQHPDGAPFTSQHYSRAPAKPPRAADTLAIHQATLRPPHFVLIHGEETIEVAKGRNNLFHTFLLFLHTVATERHGMLGRVNLGRSGVNVLWVVDR